MLGASPPPGGGGDGSSGSKAPSPRSTSTSIRPRASPAKTRKLLDEYEVGATLGEGAFGVVRACCHRKTRQEYAVKMIDKVETPPQLIMKEAEMLKNVDHPNIVKFHDVFTEKCFICIVMDLYKGGDLVDGLTRQGPFEADTIVHVAHQMALGLHYLHDRAIGHRDIKGDNYMLDRPSMLDPQVRVVLTDFGTAAIYNGDHDPFTSQVGTRQFWAPELLDKRYGLKVDIWALGVLTYGLVTGRFPFKDQADIRKKVVKVSSKVDPLCRDYILAALEKREEVRMDHKAMMSHAWLNSMRTIEEQAADEGGVEAEIPQMIREDGAHVGIRDRRDELVERLQQQHQKGQGHPESRSHAASDLAPFVVSSTEHPGHKLGYEWWDLEMITSRGLLEAADKAKPAAAELLQEMSDLSLFTKMLEEHGIDTRKFGTGNAKTLKQLAAEVASGEARLMLDAGAHKRLVRVVDILVLRLYTSDDRSQFLVETELAPSADQKSETMRLPAVIRAPHENIRDSGRRLLTTLNLSADKCTLFLDRCDKCEEECESRSYPGVQTIYNKEIIEGVVKVAALSDMELASIGLPDLKPWSCNDPREGTKFHAWMTEQEAQAKNVQYKAHGWDDGSALYYAPVGMNEMELRSRLELSGIDVSHFGNNTSKSLKEFSSELLRGKASLMQSSDGKLVRTVNVVIIVLREPQTNRYLVQTHQIAPNGTRKENARLPGGKCRPDENHFVCARGIVRRELDMDENRLRFNETVSFVEEQQTSPSYPAITTIYKKFFITAEMLSSIPDNC